MEYKKRRGNLLFHLIFTVGEGDYDEGTKLLKTNRRFIFFATVFKISFHDKKKISIITVEWMRTMDEKRVHIMI